MTDIRLTSGGTALLRVLLLAGVATLPAACGDDGSGPFSFLGGGSTETAEGPSADGRSVRLVERDVEAPDVFQVTEAGLWDGRPSLGGVWVAHPDVKEPERVIIRNTTNRNFVIGALFRKEREMPGPRLQVSSDAAEALGMLAGKPVNLNVTALRREEVQPDGAEAADVVPAPADSAALEAPGAISQSTLDPVSGTAEAAIAAAETGDSATASPAPAAAPQPAEAPPAPAASDLDRPYLQIGIFSVEQNARNSAEAMRQAGMVPTVRKQSSQGKTFWRVIVGPAGSVQERAALLDKIKATGFTDAYAVTN